MRSTVTVSVTEPIQEQSSDVWLRVPSLPGMTGFRAQSTAAIPVIQVTNLDVQYADWSPVGAKPIDHDADSCAKRLYGWRVSTKTVDRQDERFRQCLVPAEKMQIDFDALPLESFGLFRELPFAQRIELLCHRLPNHFLPGPDVDSFHDFHQFGFRRDFRSHNALGLLKRRFHEIKVDSPHEILLALELQIDQRSRQVRPLRNIAH